MMSPVCRKFPGLKLVFSEGGIGWVPNAFERADRIWLRHGAYDGSDDILPSEIFRQNMCLCMIEEPVGLQLPRRHRRRPDHVGVRLPAHRHAVARLQPDARLLEEAGVPDDEGERSPTATPSGCSAGRWRRCRPARSLCEETGRRRSVRSRQRSAADDRRPRCDRRGPLEHPCAQHDQCRTRQDHQVRGHDRVGRRGRRRRRPTRSS